MDGHDEKTDGVGFGQNNQPMSPVTPNNTNNLSQNTGSNLPGAIVSTPDIAVPQVYNAADYIDHPAGLGDIKLNNGKKSKKWLWVALGVVVAVLIVGILVFVIMQQLTTHEVSLKARFNEYANYFLYGTDSKNDIEGDYEYGNIYYLADISLSNEQIDEYFKTSEQKYRRFLEDFRKMIEKQPDLVSDEVKRTIEEYYEKLDLYYRLTVAPMLGFSTILDMYFESGIEQVKDYVGNYYNIYSQSGFEKVRQYNDDFVNKTDDLLSAIRLFDSAGCLASDNIILECQVDTESASLRRANKLLQEYLNLASKTEENNSSNQIQVYRNIWVMREEI